MLDQLAVPTATDVSLTVSVSDADGDPVTVQWAVTDGVLRAADQGKPTMQWSTPPQAEVDTVTITLTDPNGGKTVLVESVQVATLRNQDVNPGQLVVWGLVDSPYLVRPSSGGIFSIQGTGSLDIEAGVQLFMDTPDMEIQVNGRLRTLGTTAQPVVIKPNTSQPSRGWWKGIRLLPDNSLPEIDLQHAVISHAENAVNATITTTTTVDGCFISFCSGVGILHQASGPLTVLNSAITNNTLGGIRVEQTSQLPATITIQNDSIATNGRFQDTTDYTDLEAGISLIIDDPLGFVAIDISGNEISRNDFPGVRLGNPNISMALFPTIRDNGIFGNELRKSGIKTQIRLEPNFQGSKAFIDATQNYWGQAFPNPTDSATIRLGIVDHEDSPSTIAPWVYVTPWRTARP